MSAAAPLGPGAPRRPRGAPGRSRRAVRIGWIPAVYGALAAIYALAILGLGVATMVAPALVLTALVLEPALALGVPVATVGLLVALLVLGVLTLLRARSLQPGTPGRGRLLAASVTGLAHVLTYAPAFSLVAWGLSQPLTGTLIGALDPTELLLALPQSMDVVLLVLLAASSVSLLGLLIALISSWFLVPAPVRFWFWVVSDALLAVVFVAATLTLSLDPPADAPDATTLPAMRLAITVLFVIRALIRLTPVVLDLIESLGFNPLVAARLLRTRKSNFLTTIGLLSILAVTVSSCALTTTLSVMGGFRNDLKQKILGNNAHVVVDREHATFDRWLPVLETVRAAEGVTGASPYVSGEVMVTSASNLAGGVLRGIDPSTVGDVIDLQSNIVRGRLEYLVDPERLLDLPPEETGGPIPLDVPTLHLSPGEDPPPAPEGGGPTRNVDEFLEALPDPDQAEEIDRFLRGPAPTSPPRDVLPGIIVGQELARSLRLYVGDEVNVVSPLGELGPAGPMPKSRPFRVAGIFYSGMYEYDMKYMYVLLPTAQRFLNAGEEISGIEVKVEDFEQAPLVADTIRESLGRDYLRVEDWQERNKNLFGALELEKLAMFIALGIAILVAGFCVFGTLTLMVQEKEREVGILKAMGTRHQQIVTVFMIEGLLIGLFGAALGLGGGYVVCFAAEHFGIRMNPEVYYIDKLPVHIDNLEFLLVGVSSVVMCLLATVFPAVMASKTRPVDALRYE